MDNETKQPTFSNPLEQVVILPCPFCGENSEVEQCEPSTARFNEGAVHFKVSCPPVIGGYISDCIGSQLNHWEITPEDAINKWNTRAI